MPSLPKKNTLDYNPDSVFNASKKIRNIALVNMKNPTLDPDMQSLSMTAVDESLDENFGLLEQMYNELNATTMRLQRVLGKDVKINIQKLRGGGTKVQLAQLKKEKNQLVAYYKALENELEELRKNHDMPDEQYRTEVGRIERKLRLLKQNIEEKKLEIKNFKLDEEKETKDEEEETKEINDEKKNNDENENDGNNENDDFQTDWEAFVTDLRRYIAFSIEESDTTDNTDDVNENLSRFNDIYNRIRQKYPDYTYNSFQQIINTIYAEESETSPTPSRSPSPTPSISPLSSPTSSRSTSPVPLPPPPPSYDPNRTFLDYNDDNNRKIIDLLIQINSQIQKINFFLNSKIKPGFRSFNAPQQEFLQDFKKVFSNYYKETFSAVVDRKRIDIKIIEEIENGKEILQLIKQSIAKLLLDLQFSLSNNISVGAGRHMQISGGGRNFYGKNINNSRDIPTIRSSYQNITTKYLL